ncbi:response regulator with -like receiver domain protein and winged-helix dna-binding domain protein [Leptolyngbya sp. Heron Island J]|uniref:response regulator n=1 Tax=Leptolyngbya sp. Heron Island J TaxID=1385935 RepID=UPI0003B9A035|nr:response regulator [Leptolyngbya sp. Heron Island J]ESA35672.1 response regulator with -like receiver domain protein and winged-helix dna-binding domain protein [Leptolyngbya sp. Heron Island J]
MLQFNANQLGSVLLKLQHDGFSGVAYVEVQVSEPKLRRPRVLSFFKGELTYAGLYLPEPYELSQKLGKKFKLQIMDAALQLASRKVADQSSIRQYLDLFIRLELFKWQDVESFIRNQIVLTLEEILPYAGQLKCNSSVMVDLTYGEDNHGFRWQQLEDDLAQRRRGWAGLLPAIASRNSIPHRISAAQQTISDPWVQQHLHQWIDGQRTLGEIADGIGRDPLELAHSYAHYVQMGWLTFRPDKKQDTPINLSSPITMPSKPVAAPARQQVRTILSVDDSPVVQTMIKRIVDDRYNLLLADNAMDALNLLNRENIDLLLLDVTMPDIDGLELCRTIRKINKFRELPVIMLTAKDGMFNKIKGQMAGSTHYLTKPIDRQKLMEVLNRYIPDTVMS